MSTWFEVAAGGILGLALVGGVFWLAFGRMPERRSDGGLKHDADHYTSGDDGGGHHSV